MVAYARMKVSEEESFKVQFIFHVRFIASSKVCLSESTVVSLRSFVLVLSFEEFFVLVSSPGQPLSLDRTQGRRTL